VTGTVPPNGEANDGVAPAGEETFTKVDPKTLPPQLRQSYENMLRDYKEKTTKISETIKSESSKEAVAYRQQAEAYDQIAQQEEFVRQWNEYVQKSQNQTKEEPGDPKLSQLEAKFQEINQKLQLSEMSQITEAFADAVNEKGVKLHPEFDELNSLSIGQVQDGEDFSLLRACVELAQGSNPQEKLANGYKSAKAAYNAIFESGKKAGMGRVQAKVMNGSQPPTNSGGDILSVTDKKPKSAKEALDMARKGLVVSRD
jgi:hypothetical protein